MASAAKPKVTATAKPAAKAAASKPKAKSATSSKSKQRPPPMEPGQATVYYMQGKVHRNSGCFRVFKLASDKKDLKIKIVPDAETCKQKANSFHAGKPVFLPIVFTSLKPCEK